MPRLGKFTVLVAGALALSGLLAHASGAVACDLQPENQNPVALPYVKLSPLASEINKTFMAGAASQRFYDHVEALDGITLGFGHWPQAEIVDLFRDLKQYDGGKAFAAFTDCLVEFFALKREAKPSPKNSKTECDKARARSTDGVWRRAQETAKLTPMKLSRERVIAVLEKTLLSKRFEDRYDKNCNHECKSGQADMFHENEKWLVPALCYALRDRSVILWQVAYWNSDVVEPAAKMVDAAGLKDDAIAAISAGAYVSTAPAWFKDIIKASKTGTLFLARYNYKWHWNKPPLGAPTDTEGLRSWRHFILWQYYAAKYWEFRVVNKKTPRIRSRSVEFYDKYLKDDWIVPALDKHGKPETKNRSNLDPALVKPKT